MDGEGDRTALESVSETILAGAGRGKEIILSQFSEGEPKRCDSNLAWIYRK